jgi:hypothetical protein
LHRPQLLVVPVDDILEYRHRRVVDEDVDRSEVASTWSMIEARLTVGSVRSAARRSRGGHCTNLVDGAGQGAAEPHAFYVGALQRKVGAFRRQSNGDASADPATATRHDRDAALTTVSHRRFPLQPHSNRAAVRPSGCRSTLVGTRRLSEGAKE